MTSAPKLKKLETHAGDDKALFLNSTDSYFESKNDTEIWNMFREGHVGAFRYVYMTYYNRINSYGCRITKDHDLVKDCIQELFIELRKSKHISSTNSIQYYLMKALKWKIYRKLEINKRFFSLEDESSSFEPDYVESTETTYIVQETANVKRKKLKSALQQLTKRQKEAFYYFYDQNMNYQEMAEIMSLSSVKSARNLIYKAIKSLKKGI